MAREADMKMLQNLTTRLKQDLEEAALSENGAEYASFKADAVGSVGSLIGKRIGSAIAGPAWREEAFEKELTARRTRRQCTFGTIVVCVGKRGLPDDVHVVSISKLARTHNRFESEVIQLLQQRGVLLFSPDVFHVMFGTLIEQLREGKLRLPISPKQLPAKLAIPRKVTVRLLTSIQLVPQLPAPKNTSTGDKGDSPNDTI